MELSRLRAVRTPTRPRAQTDLGLRGRLLTALEEVVALAPAWEALRRRVEASPFAGPDLYLGWLAERSGGAHPHVVAVEDGQGTLRAVAPWARRGAVAYSVPGREKVAGELVVEQADGPAAWRAALATALGTPLVPVLFVPHATDDLAGVLGAAAACQALRLPHRVWPRFRRYRLPLEGVSFESYLARWTKDRRRVVRRTRRQLEEQGEVRLAAVPGPAGYDALRALHLRQWTPQSTISWLHTATGERIDRQLLAALPSTVLLLEVAGRPIAAALWIDTGRTRTCVYLTRDVGVTRGSPGRFLHAEVVRRACEDGVAAMDWMGRGGRKEVLGIEEHIGYELTIGRGAIGEAFLAARQLHLAARAGSGSTRARAILPAVKRVPSTNRDSGPKVASAG